MAAVQVADDGTCRTVRWLSFFFFLFFLSFFLSFPFTIAGVAMSAAIDPKDFYIHKQKVRGGGEGAGEQASAVRCDATGSKGDRSLNPPTAAAAVAVPAAAVLAAAAAVRMLSSSVCLARSTASTC